MLNLARIQAISLDLDDTLWPVWPTIRRAEQVLLDWLQLHVPATAAHLSETANRHAVREQVEADHPDKTHDLSWLRHETIRRSLLKMGDDVTLTDAAFEVFFAERQRVDFYPDALDALERLSDRYTLAAVSNGNADVQRVGIGRHFQLQVSAKDFGVPKPDPRIYHHTAQRLGLAPEQVLHIGDDAHLDAVAARSAGMQVVWLNREGKDWPLPQEAPALSVNTLAELVDRILR